MSEEKKGDDDVMMMSTLQTHAQHQLDNQKTEKDNMDALDSTAINRNNNNNQKSNRASNDKSESLLLLLCATGITSCYLWYGSIQEHLFKLNDDKDEQSITLFLLATGTFSSFVLAAVWTLVGPLLLGSDDTNTDRTKSNKQSSDDAKSQSARREGLNHPLLLLTSLTYLSAMAASNESLHYVSYPTCVLAKSSKLIPNMIVGWIVERLRGQQHGNDSNHKKSHSIMEWLGAAFITLGIIGFQYIQLHKQSQNMGSDAKGDSPYGLALLGVSLFMDGLLGACQSVLKQKNAITTPGNRSGYRPPLAMETMLYTNLYATLILLPASYYKGQFHHGMKMIVPSEDIENQSTLLLQLNLSASLGQVFIFLTIHHFSPLICTTITTTRKFFTILLSVYKFGHVLDAWQWGSVGLVFGGLYLEIVAKLFGRGGGDGGVVKKKTKKE